MKKQPEEEKAALYHLYDANEWDARADAESAMRGFAVGFLLALTAVVVLIITLIICL